METKKENASIYEALIEARKGFKAVKKDSTNPFYKSRYASLGAIIEAIEQPMLENGLWFRFEEEPITNVDKISVNKISVVIYNGKGEQITCSHNYVVDEPTCQGFGKASTYAQRYALSAALGIVGEDDEDGNTKQLTKKPTESNSLDEIKSVEGVTVTDDGNVVTVAGKTFSLSNNLKSLGFHWDGQTKTWKKSKSQAA